MKSLEQLDSWISSRVRTWSSRFSGAPKSRELLEIRRDILNDVRDHIQPRGEGKCLFPYNAMSIHIGAQDATQQTILEEAFSHDNELQQTISALLAEAGCFLPAGLQVTVAVSQEPASQPDGPAFRIDYSNKKSDTTLPLQSVRPLAKLTVIRGQADATEYVIDSDRVNIGRLQEVISDKDGLRRRNHVSFAETETTVSREHAFIRYDAESGKFRLYDSMSQRGTNVFRDGRRFEVPKGPTHGFQLRSGDEIHLGGARLRFDIDAVEQ
jgi:hypothetical protein